MTIPVHPDLLAVLDAVTIASPTRYSFLGRRRDVPATPDGRALCSAIEFDLYQGLYTRPTDRFDPPPVDVLARRDHLAACSAANCGAGTWEAGWTVGQVDEDGQVAVAKDGMTFWVDPSGLRADGGSPQPGAACRVRVGKELRNLIPGFYVAIGDAEAQIPLPAGEGGRRPGEVGRARYGDDRSNLDPASPSPQPSAGGIGGREEYGLVRYYWHLTAAAAAPFLKETTSRLNAEAVPFRAKVLTDPAVYRRADAGVLYLARRDHARAEPALAAIHEAIAPGLRPEVPLFTRPLADGLGLAEDPGDDLSYGEARCRLVARALLRSFNQGDPDPAARAATLVAAFTDAGFDPIRPHLGPGSRAIYAFRPFRGTTG